jgi:xanthine dehydrogenase YagS FAD-binding subunit
LEAGAFARLRLVAGGVAPLPLRLRGAEAAALGKPASTETLAAAAEAAIAGANPLPASRYKLELLRSLVRDQLEAVAAQT